MSEYIASLWLGKNWHVGEWPDFVYVAHEGVAEYARKYTLERTCYMNDRDVEGYTVPDSICGDGFCSECDGIIDVEDRYCPDCGARIEAK